MSFVKKIAEDKKNLAIFIVAIAILVLASWHYGIIPWSSKQMSSEERKQVVQSLVDSFPDEFILDKGAEVTFGNAESKEDGLQITKILASKKSMEELISLYSSAFSGDGWVKETDKTLWEGLQVLSFYNADSNVHLSVTFEDRVGYVQVAFSYFPDPANFKDPLKK